MPRTLFLLVFFACFGITAEVFFVAFTNLYNNEPFCNEPLWSLTGKTYVWMAFIYALIPVFAGFFYNKLKHLPAPLRWTIYTLLIFTVEYISGFLLEQFTGRCPWLYTTGWQVSGYIRLDYTPAWFFFSAIVEYLYRFVSGLFDAKA